MNQNPWFVERMVEYDQDRVRRDMKQIRLEEEALKAGRRMEEKTIKAPVHRPRLVLRVLMNTVRWLVSAVR